MIQFILYSVQTHNTNPVTPNSLAIMYSEASSELWANELLEALLAEGGISARTKEVCSKLKHKHNPWQKELREMWRKLVYPIYTQ